MKYFISFLKIRFFVSSWFGHHHVNSTYPKYPYGYSRVLYIIVDTRVKSSIIVDRIKHHSIQNR